MVKITLEIDGMACSMCEAHINDAVRKAFPVKKVTSSHSKRRTEVVSENEISEAELKKVVESRGYKLVSIKSEPYVKKGFSLFGKK